MDPANQFNPNESDQYYKDLMANSSGADFSPWKRPAKKESKARDTAIYDEELKKLEEQFGKGEIKYHEYTAQKDVLNRNKRQLGRRGYY